MDKEKKLIELISSIMPRTALQLNKVYEADAEIINYKNGKLLFTIDEFSQEDMFREDDPYNLGWNCAIGGISDIWATGGKPLFYAHSLTINDKWSQDYISSFCFGVSAVLKKSKIAFIGGDFGQSNLWRYNVVCLGEVSDRPLLRSGAQLNDLIYISGKIGAGNVEAALTLYAEKINKSIKNCFCLRIKESELINKYATSCIDTSDGVFNALNTVAEMSSKGYRIGNLPYLETGLTVAKLLAIPKIVLFLGEAGEYELLFTIKNKDEQAFLQEAEAQKLQFYNIGQITDLGMRTLIEDNKEIDLSKIDIRGRDFTDVKGYLNELLKGL